MWKGFCLDKLGRNDEGLDCYKKAIEITPRALWILTNKVRLDLMFNNNEECMFTLRALLRINPKDHIALGIMGGVLTDLRKDEQALIFYNRALAIELDNATLLCGKGTSLDNIRRTSEAYDCFERALEIEPNNFGVLTNKGVVLQKLGREKEALAAYDKALMVFPTFGNALYYKARLKAKQHSYDEALSLLKKAIKSDVNYKIRARSATEFHILKHDATFLKLIN